MKSCEKQNSKKQIKRQKNKEIEYSKLDIAIKEAGYNYTQFAKEISVNKSTVSSWCMGAYAPSEQNLHKIVEILNKGRMQEGKTLYDVLYFRKDIEQKNIDNYALSSRLGILDNAISTLENLKKQQDFYKTNDAPGLQNMHLIYEKRLFLYGCS